MLTVSEMREAERQAIDSGQVTGFELMQRAGSGIVAALADHWPGSDGITQAPWAGQIVLILCGPGNNGGDGYIVAQKLVESGADVRLMALGDPAKLTGDAALAFAAWTGVTIKFDATAMEALADEAVARGQGWLCILDALFGIGQRAPMDNVTDAVGRLIDHMMGGAGPTPWIVAVDLPTGYDADTGAALARRPIWADLTVTFHAPKPIHGMPHFMDSDLVIVDIGI